MSDTQQAPTTTSGHVCWFEIPVSDLDRAQQFYEHVLDIKMQRNDDGPNPMVAFTSMDDPQPGGHLYPGKPGTSGTGNTIHLVAADPLETVMGRVTKAGGEVASDVIDIPFGRFVYMTDPDGNSVGLFNYKA